MPALALLTLLVWVSSGVGCSHSGRGTGSAPPAGSFLEGAADLEPGLRDAITELLGTTVDSTPDDVAEAALSRLAEGGYLSARLCPRPGGGWRLESGARVDTLEFTWQPVEAEEAPIWAEDLPQRISRRSATLSQGASHAVGQAVAALDAAGHPLAEIRLLGFSHPRRSRLRLELAIRAGPRVEVAGVRFVGAPGTRPAHLRRVIDWEGRETYRGPRWQDARERLLATGLFAEVRGPELLLPEMPPAAAPADTTASRPGGAGAIRRAIVRFDLTERPVSRLQGVLGYSGESATLAGFVDLALGNLFGTGRAMRLFWQRYGREASRFEFAWHEPFLWRLPLELDAELSHEAEDTLFARTRWGVALSWRPVPRWDAAVGWSRDRMVFGEPVSGSLGRSAVRFGVQRRLPDPERSRRGWELDAAFERTTGTSPSLRRFDVTLWQWQAFGRWGVWLEHSVGLVGGGERFFRSDGYRVGGSRSLRGYHEGEIRALRYVLQRAEFGPRLDLRGARLYLLCDLSWLEEWAPDVDGILGTAGTERVPWSAGIGVRLPSRAGAVRLDYAVPRGGTLGQGRVHFGLESRF